MKMSDITVVILTKNEEKNITAVVQNAKKVAKDVLIVDSGSTDKTVQLSEENGAMSLAYNANIYYDLDRETIKRVVLALMSYHDVSPMDVKEEEDETRK